MSIIDRVKELNKKWIVSVVFITIVAGGIIFLLFQNINENTRKSIELKERIDELTRSTEELTLVNKKLKKSKDSLQQHVTYMWPMRSIVYNAKLRDKVMSGIEFVPGQKVRVKTDSSIVIITDYLVGGNNYNYYVHFRVKNKKGEVQEYSPLEIEAVER